MDIESYFRSAISPTALVVRATWERFSLDFSKTARGMYKVRGREGSTERNLKMCGGIVM